MATIARQAQTQVTADRTAPIAQVSDTAAGGLIRDITSPSAPIFPPTFEEAMDTTESQTAETKNRDDDKEANVYYNTADVNQRVGKLPNPDYKIKEVEIRTEYGNGSRICLFKFAPMFGGTKCSEYVVAGICQTHWNSACNINFINLAVASSNKIVKDIHPVFINTLRTPMSLMPFATNALTMSVKDFKRTVASSFEYARKFHSNQWQSLVSAYSYMIRPNMCTTSVESSEVGRMISRNLWLRDQRILLNSLTGMYFVEVENEVTNLYSVNDVSVFDTPMMLLAVRSSLSHEKNVMSARSANISIKNNAIITTVPIEIGYSRDWRLKSKASSVEEKHFSMEMLFETPTLLCVSSRPSKIYLSIADGTVQYKLSLGGKLLGKDAILPKDVPTTSSTIEAQDIPQITMGTGVVKTTADQDRINAQLSTMRDQSGTISSEDAELQRKKDEALASLQLPYGSEIPASVSGTPQQLLPQSVDVEEDVGLA